jgi:NADH-quinone oxidoreductase subunit L
VIHALHGEQDMRRMGGLKRYLPVTYWTFLIGALAIAGVPGLAGFFSKDEILFRTFVSGHTLLWTIGVITSLLTATYMFRLVFMTFHGERAPAAAGDDAHAHAAGSGSHGVAAPHGAAGGSGAAVHGGASAGHEPGDVHHAHLHDAPPAMAIPLIILAIGSVVAGYIGVPHALGGSNRIETFLEPSFHPAHYLHTEGASAPAGGASGSGVVSEGEIGSEHAEAAGGHGAAADTATELSLMGVSSVIAVLGILLAAFFFLWDRRRADGVAQAMPGLYRLLLNKYYVDELYDDAIVQPINRTSERLLWKIVDTRLIDGAVNGAGAVVRGGAAVMRLAQTGSVRAYAASLFVGVLIIMAYYLAR